VDDVKEGGKIKGLKKGGSERERLNTSGEIASHVVKLPTFLSLLDSFI